MRIIISIFLLQLLVFVQTPVGQLLKLPVLVMHFAKHQKQEGLSLFEFLQEHYAANHNDSDQKEDERLPFRNMDYYAIDCALMPVAIKSEQIIFFPAEKKKGLTDMYTPQQRVASIFHPPRS